MYVRATFLAALALLAGICMEWLRVQPAEIRKDVDYVVSLMSGQDQAAPPAQDEWLPVGLAILDPGQPLTLENVGIVELNRRTGALRLDGTLPVADRPIRWISEAARHQWDRLNHKDAPVSS